MQTTVRNGETDAEIAVILDEYGLNSLKQGLAHPINEEEASTYMDSCHVRPGIQGQVLTRVKKIAS